jgi:hypothetical protein
MAEVKTIKIDVDTKQAVNAMENLSKATNDVNKSFEEVYGDLQPLTTRMGEAEDRLYELANAGQTATQEYQDLLETVGRYRKVQIQTDMAVDAAATTMAQKLGGALGGATAGFELMQGVMGTFGAESEQVEKLLLKVQSAMAISQGVQGVREAIPAITAFGTAIKTQAIAALTTLKGALITTGIGALVVALGFAANAMGLFGDSSEDAEKQQEKLDKQLEKTNAELERQQKLTETVSQTIDNRVRRELIDAKKRGASEKELQQIEKEGAKSRLESLKQQEAAAKKLYLQKSKDTKASTKEFEAAEKAYLDVSQKVIDARLALDEKEAEITYQRLQERKDSKKESAKEDKAERNAAQKEALRNAIEFENELNSRLEQIAEQNYLNSLSEQDKEIRLVQDKYFELETLAAGNADALREIEIAKLNEINDINLKYQQEAYDLDKEAAEKKKELDKKSKEERIEAEKAVTETLATIREQDFNNIQAGLNLISSLFENNKKVQAAVLVAENAVGIAKTIMNTQAANQLARAQGTALAIASGGASVAAAEALVVRNNIGAGISIASQIAATAKGLSALKAGGAPASGSISDGGGGGGVMSPNFNIVGNSGFNQLAQIQQQPIQAYVVSGEVTSAQALDRNRIKNATL